MVELFFKDEEHSGERPTIVLWGTATQLLHLEACHNSHYVNTIYAYILSSYLAFQASAAELRIITEKLCALGAEKLQVKEICVNALVQMAAKVRD